MDIVLDIADNLILDKVWATVWPALPRSVLSNPDLIASATEGSSGVLSNLTNGLGLSNAIKSAGQEVDWESLRNMSALPRDNIIR